MSRFLSLILLLACLSLIVWFLPSTRNLNKDVGAFSTSVAAAEEESSFRILFGMTDRESTKLDGALAVSQGAIARIEPWRFDEDDKIEESSAASARWKISTRQGRAFGAQPRRPVVADGVIVTFHNLTSASEVSVETTQGKFSFRPSDLPYGKAAKPLDGRVMVDRVTAGGRIAGPRDEQDYPAAATDREGNVWAPYAQFTPNPKVSAGQIVDAKVETKLAPSPVEYAVLLPDGYETAKDPLPLLLFLHGGGGDKSFLTRMRSVFDELWKEGTLPPIVRGADHVGRTIRPRAMEGLAFLARVLNPPPPDPEAEAARKRLEPLKKLVGAKP